ncbi:spore gernimation protein [Paenibacillus albiflavus]|uniref:Spore gernimation protein n=1 Tax=Paenibacillus albiflavus TaxID=2545760 RepID=A0A4R4E5I7_9BACL|nr:endospore germination permease [Paenibacillus albiflavus]TCZ74010.1 spore gernimation protein [Paenibacillus albiflavus]
MLEKGIISNRQFILLVALITIGDSILVLPAITVSAAKQDGWISALIGLAVGLVIISLFCKVGKLYPQLNLIESIQQIFGKWVGTIVSFVFLTYPFLSAVTHIRETGDFIVTEIMPETPIQAILILWSCVFTMAVQLGLEVIGRIGEIFFPWVMFLFLIFIVFLLSEIKIDNIKPFLENGLRPVIHGSLTFTAFSFMELVGFLMIFPYVKHPNKIQKGFIQGALIGGITLVILIVISILVLGPDLTARSTYSSYTLAMKVRIGSFLERVEIILAIMWILTTFFKIVLNIYIVNLGLAHLLKLSEYRVLIFPLIVIIIALASIIVPNTTYFGILVSQYWPFFDLTFAVILPLLLLGVYYIRQSFNVLK